ncbi:MAG: hypothetical protein JNL58_01905 [Planctomyces sp.]|nr:hypothetical protein [Planctomyces sp.]
MFLLLVSLLIVAWPQEVSLRLELSPRLPVIAVLSAIAITAFAKSQVVRAIPVAIALVRVIAAKAAVAAILVTAANRRVLPAP